MEIEPILHSKPRLGLFWFIAKDRNHSRFASISRPFSRVAEVAGFKTLDEGHVDVWPTLQRLDQSLADYDYDYFPRGRVNWRREDDSMAPGPRRKAQSRAIYRLHRDGVENPSGSITPAARCTLS